MQECIAYSYLYVFIELHKIGSVYASHEMRQ